MALDLKTYDMINPRERQADAIAFSVLDWTNVAYIPGQTNLTGHSRTIIPESPIKSANVCFVIENTTSSPCEVRAVGLQYDIDNQPAWLRTWGSVVNTGVNQVQQLRQDIKAGLNAAFSTRGYVYVHVEVRGAGRLYMATSEVTWDKPDVIDYSRSIADLVTRVSVLEPGTALSLRVSALESRIEALRQALAGN